MSRTPVRDMLDVWPALPLNIMFNGYSSTGSVDNIIAALECTDRVYRISLTDVRSLEIFLAAMQQPFPELTHLQLYSIDKTVTVVPDSFLGGSAPRLEDLRLRGIPSSGLPKLLLSATHLFSLFLFRIPHSGYISPDGMATVLSTLTSLEDLRLSFESPLSLPEPASRRPPPSTRSLLPILTSFCYAGVSEYLEDLVACIDAPQLIYLRIIFFDDIVFNTPQLVRFISHTKSKAFEKAYITLHNDATVDFSSSQTSHYFEFSVTILCKVLNQQVSSLEQLCTSCLPFLSILEDLHFYMGSHPNRNASLENRQWLELLRPFMAVKNLYISEEFASRIAPALQELVEGRTTDVLPALQNIFLNLKWLESHGSVQEGIRQFVAARQVANHPIGISPWTDEEDED
jgi:hypothetical protein